MSQIQDEINRLEETLKQLEDKPSRSQFEENQIIRIKEQLQTLELQAMTLDELNAKKTELESQEPLNESEYKRITNRINELELEQQQAEAKQQIVSKQEQAKEEHLSGLQEVIASWGMFEILFPRSEFVPMIGLSEYDEKMQQFNQLVYLGTVEVQKQVIDAKDAEILSLNTKLLQISKQAMEAEDQLTALKASHSQKDADLAKLNADMEQIKRESEGKDMVINAKQEQIDQLQENLKNAAAPKPAIDITPSQDFKDALAKVKESNVEKANRALKRWELPPIPQPDPKESPFRGEGEANPPSDAANTGISHTETQSVGGEQFHTQNEVPAEAVQAPAPAGDLVSETVSRSEFEALQQRVEALEKQNRSVA